MIRIVEGSLDDSKEQMKKTISLVKGEVSKFKRSVRPSNRSKSQKETIAKHEAFVHFFRVSQMQPVYVENICINYLLYTRFLKKLKGYQIKETVHDKSLVVSYSKGSSSGKLILQDITDKLDGLMFFPRGVIESR
ncbi:MULTISPECIES: hypothetical protein [unclassified Oceanobacillus]|uniref:hypothetical protein n=1 Tax=unclassified Oceanobacillus TaxID=2630292 RepID=UPI001BE81537|nr:MULTISPECIES: hypothetical protein [unclassified Oceanobacillus]MBT2599107.1 hypothetical protein [Oceanobacillus sp. ISL-74]MBT2652025.1 hypothetical protein [Oceanobacillus sp. ISL-73]